MYVHATLIYPSVLLLSSYLHPVNPEPAPVFHWMSPESVSPTGCVTCSFRSVCSLSGVGAAVCLSLITTSEWLRLCGYLRAACI